MEDSQMFKYLLHMEMITMGNQKTTLLGCNIMIF